MNKEKVLVVIWKIGIYHDLSSFYLCYHLSNVRWGGNEGAILIGIY
ncbi:hypothetical protein Geoth_2527 [Parageobacillus thermoglucosidasius C56-YS93]|nr:hypothetical protein Geoth_2527 [Parageobacillus thermoglucosidasius C56-YS93]